ncbi:MAG: zinc-ribbon domain-containing protein [Clostridia bacterium]|nr:zinc-ribbon domain-containing protein [Clostridia bacterium]
MYCKNCGRILEEGSLFCNNCGTKLDANRNVSEDSSSFGFAILGFFIPLVGLILFLIYEGKKPKRAKSAGKGALIGFITKIVLSIILVVLYIAFSASLFSNILNETESNIPIIGSVFEEETTDQILEKYVEVSFGEFKITNNGYFSETSLDVKVKNIAEKQYTYHIIIEAVDENGTRIDTDTIYAEKLNAGQDVNLTAFEYVEEDRINQFKSATFRVLEINKYDF